MAKTRRDYEDAEMIKSFAFGMSPSTVAKIYGFTTEAAKEFKQNHLDDIKNVKEHYGNLAKGCE